MADLWYGHFDSTEEDERELTAEDLATFVRVLWTDGIRNGGTNLQVTADSGMNLKLDSGDALIRGYAMSISADAHGNRYYPVNLEPAHPSLPRIDRVILRLDRTIAVRSVTPKVLLGTAGSSPAPPALTRNNNIWELSLAQVRVNAGALNITSANITDERMDTVLCGLINPKLGLDPSAWQAQFDAFLAAMRTDNTAFIAARVAEWNAAKATQQSSWETQMAGQRSDYATFKAGIDAWKLLTIAEFQKNSGFNFDNQVILPGTYKTFDNSTANQINEWIKLTSNNNNVANLLTVFAPDGSITRTLTVYNSDGTIFSRTRETVTFPSGNPRSEVVSV